MNIEIDPHASTNMQETHNLIKKMRPKDFINSGIVALAILFLVNAFIFFFTDIFKNDGYVNTQGVIVDYTEVIDKETNEYTYYPIIEYEVNGVKYTLHGKNPIDYFYIGDNIQFYYNNGDTIKIQYKQDEPHKARVKSDNTEGRLILISADTLLIIMSLSLIITGMVKLKKSKI